MPSSTHISPPGAYISKKATADPCGFNLELYPNGCNFMAVGIDVQNVTGTLGAREGRVYDVREICLYHAGGDFCLYYTDLGTFVLSCPHLM